MILFAAAWAADSTVADREREARELYRAKKPMSAVLLLVDDYSAGSLTPAGMQVVGDSLYDLGFYRRARGIYVQIDDQFRVARIDRYVNPIPAPYLDALGKCRLTEADSHLAEVADRLRREDELMAMQTRAGWKERVAPALAPLAEAAEQEWRDRLAGIRASAERRCAQAP